MRGEARESLSGLIIHMSSTGNAKQMIGPNEPQRGWIITGNDFRPDLWTANGSGPSLKNAASILILKAERLSGFGRIESISDNFEFDRSFK